MLLGFCLFAWNQMAAVLYLISVPAIAYIIIKGVIYDGMSSGLASILYSDKAVTSAKEEFSLIKGMIKEHRYEEALVELQNHENGHTFEGQKLRMTVLYDNLGDKVKAVEIGYELLSDNQLNLEHAEVLNLCVDICLELNEPEQAILLLKTYGPKLPSEASVKNAERRLQTLA